MFSTYTPLAGFVRWGVALAGLALLLVGCVATSTGGAATPSATSTLAPTATPSVPTLRYKIETRNRTLQELPNVALEVSAGYQWTQATSNGLTCASGGAADPGGSAGHPTHQVFTCQLVTGRSSGQSTLVFAEVGASTPREIAQVEVDSLTGTQGSTPGLRYQITTSAHFKGSASVALAVNAGTNYQWTPATDFRGLTCASQGAADPGGPAGHVQYQVFTCQLAASQASGTGSFTFAEVGSNTPTDTAQVTVALGD